MSESSSQSSRKEIFPIEENIKAILRLKPSIYDSDIYIENKSQCYDTVYNEDVLNRKIYDNSILSVVKSFMKGVDVNFMAFGPKDGGKTYTFIGEKFNINAFKKDSKGIALYAITSIFKALNFMKEKNIKYQIGYSLVEIPDEDTNYKFNDITLQESFKGFNNLKDVKQAILKHYKEKKYNNSHTVFNVALTQYRMNKKTNQMMKLESKLNFIDFSHSITERLLNKIDINPNSDPKEILHNIVKYCPCLDKIVTKSLAGKDRTILFYCTPYLTDTQEEIEIMGKMESILQLFRQIQCNIDINCSESSNSNMVKENIAFLKKKLNRFKETIYVDEDGKRYYQGLTEDGEVIDPVDLDIYDDSRENIEPDTDESSVIDSYVEDSNSDGIIEDEDFNSEIIIKNEDILIPGENPLQTEDDNPTPRAKPAVAKVSSPYVSKQLNKGDIIEEKEQESENPNYYDVDYLETITEEDSQDVIKAMQGINDKSKITTTVLPVSTKQIINKTESSIEYGDQIVTKKTYCEPVVTEEVVNEPGGKKRIITINTETITVSKRKPIGTNKTVRTTTTTKNSNGYINSSNIKEAENNSKPFVETKIISQEPSVKKTVITEKTIVNSNPIVNRAISEKPIRTTSLKRATNMTNDKKVTNSGSPKSAASSPRTDSIRSHSIGSPKSVASSPRTDSIRSHSIGSPKSSDSDNSDYETHPRIKPQTQTQTYLLPSLVPRRISSVKPTVSPKMNVAVTKEKEQEKDGKNFIDNIKNKFTRNGKKDEHNEDTVKEEPNGSQTTSTIKNVTSKGCTINGENTIEDNKIKNLTEAIEAKDAEIKDRMEIIKQYTDTLLSLEENQILSRKNSQKYKKFEKELQQRKEEEGHKNIDELREKLKYLSTLLNEKDKQIKNIDDSVKNKEKELESSQNKLSFLISVLDEKDAIIKKSNERVKDIENKNQTLSDSVVDYEVRINNLKDQLEEKEKVNEALQSQMAELSDRINQAQERMEKLYQLQIKQKEKHKVQLEKQSLKYKKIIKKLIEKKRLSTSSFPISENSRKDYDMLSNFSKDVPSDLYSLKSDLTDVFSDDDLANLASNQHESKIYAEVLNHYNKIFKKLKEVLVENHNSDNQSLMTSPSLSNPEGSENVVRKAEEIVKTEHQHIKSEDNYQMDLVQAAETLNSQVNHWKQYSSDQQRYIENLQAEQARLMEKIETLSKLQPMKDGDKAENERLIKEANTTLESIKTEIMNSIIVDDTPAEDGKEFSLSDYKEELGLDEPNEVQSKENKVKNKSNKPENIEFEKIEKKNEQKIQHQNQKINDLRKCCDRQSEMIVNLEFSLMKAQAIIESLTQNDENAAAKYKDLTSKSYNNNKNDANTTKNTTYKRNKERINPLIYNINRNIEDSMELDESISQIQPDLYDVCNLNELPVTDNPDISTLLNSREFKNHSTDNKDLSDLQDQSSSLIIENEIIKTEIIENPKQTNQTPIAEVNTTNVAGATEPVTNQLRPVNNNNVGKYNRDSQVTLINDPTTANNNVSTQSSIPWKNNVYRQPMTSITSKYPINTETIVTTTTSANPSPVNYQPSQNLSYNNSHNKLHGHSHKSKKNDGKDGKKRNPLKNIFSKSSTESMKSDSDKDSLKKKEGKRTSFSKFFSRKNKSSNNSSNGNSSTDSNIGDSTTQSYSNIKTSEEKILPASNQIEHGEFDSDSDDDMPILQLQQKRLNSQGPLTNTTTSTTTPITTINEISIPNPPTPIKMNNGTYGSPYSSPYVTPYQSPYSSPRIKPQSAESSEYYDVNTETPKTNVTKNLNELNENEPEVIQPVNPTVKSADVSQTQSELEKEIQAELDKLHPRNHKFITIDDEILNEKKQEEFDNIPNGQIVDEGNPLFLNNFSSSKTDSDPENLKENVNVNNELQTQNQPQKTQYTVINETSTSYQPNETLYSPTINTEVNETLWSPSLPNELPTVNETPKIKESINISTQKTFIDDNLKTNYKPMVNESMTNDLTMNETLLNDITAYPVTETFYNKQPQFSETSTSADGKTTTTTETYKPSANETVQVITTYQTVDSIKTNPNTIKKTVTTTPTTSNTFLNNNTTTLTSSTSPNIKKVITTTTSSPSTSPKSNPTTIKKTITTTTTTTTNKNSTSPKSTVKKVVTTTSPKTSPKLKNSNSSTSSGPIVKKVIKTITTTTKTTNNNSETSNNIQPKVNENNITKITTYQPTFKNTTSPKITETKTTTSYQPSFKNTTTTSYQPSFKNTTTTPSSKITETKTTTTYQPSFKNTSYTPVTTYQTYKTTYSPINTPSTTTTYKQTYPETKTTYQPNYKTNTSYSPKITETTTTYKNNYSPTFKSNYSPKITETTTYPITYKTNYSPKITETVTTTTSTYPQKENEYITTTYKPTVVKKTSLGQTRITEPSVPSTTYVTETKYQNDPSTMNKLSYDYLKNINGNTTDVSSSSSSSSFVSTKQSNNYDDVGYYTTYKTTNTKHDVDHDLSIDEHDEIDDDLEDVANTTMKSIEKYEFLKRSSIKRNAKLFHNNGNSEEAQKEMDKLNEINQSLQDLKDKNRIEASKKPDEYEYITTTTTKKPVNDEYKYITTTNTSKKPINDEYKYVTTTNTTKKPTGDEYEYVTTTNTTNTTKKPISDEYEYVTTTTTNEEDLNNKQKKNKKKFRLFSKCTGNKNDEDSYTKKNKDKTKKNKKTSDEYLTTTSTTTVEEKLKNKKKNKDDEYYYATEYINKKEEGNGYFDGPDGIVVDSDDYYVDEHNNKVYKTEYEKGKNKNKGKKAADDDYYYTTTTTNKYTDNSDNYATAPSSSDYTKKNKKTNDDDSEYYYVYDTTEENTISDKNKKKQKGGIFFNYFD